MDIQSLKRDPGIIEAGRWVGDIPGMAGLRVKVRGMKSNAFRETLERLRRSLPRTERHADGTPFTAASIRITGQAVFESVLLDWDGFTRNDEPQPYDKDMALMFCTDPAYELVLDGFVWAANVVDNEQSEADEELAKNSPSPSAVSSKAGKTTA